MDRTTAKLVVSASDLVGHLACGLGGPELGSGVIERTMRDINARVDLGGSRWSIGRGSHVVAHQSVMIGDDVITGPGCYITDQNHAYADVDTPIGQQWPTNDPVSIGPGSWLGAGAVVLPGTRLGRNTVVGAGAVVRGDFPDHAVLAGIPAVVVRRYESGTGWQPSLRDVHIDAPPGWPTAQRR